MKLKFLLQSLFAIMTVYAIFSCSQKEVDMPITSEKDIHYYSESDISSLKAWLFKQKDTPFNKLSVTDDYPKTSFQAPSSASDSIQMKSYTNAIMYINDDRIHGKQTTYNNIIEMLNKDNLIDANGKIQLFSFIQFSLQVLTSKEAIHYYNSSTKDEVQLRGSCDCIGAALDYDLAKKNYSTNRSTVNYADMQNKFNIWNSCLSKIPTCPNGFTYDGANCYSGISFPTGFEGFIYGNGFYTKRNCNVLKTNNCCPPGYLFDGANCHYYGKYFPSNFTPFIWNRTFYVKPMCN